MHRYAVVGGGILGASVARRLLQVEPDAQVTLLEKEDGLAKHQTGRNSGVVHAGLYYVPGSLKAVLCRRGVSLLREFCDEAEIRYDECGKVLVALDDVERRRLDDIADRARSNGVPGVRHLDADELHELEPNVAGIAGLHSPTTAIVDFAEVTRRLAADAQHGGATVRTSTAVTGLRETGREVVVTAGGEGEAFDQVIVCAGLQGDRIAALAGDRADPRIVPFRGEYYRLRPDRRHLVRGLVYPVPDPRYPFLGVHLTPRIDGEVLVGPNAVLALAREGYGRLDVSGRDLKDTLAYAGFRRFARQHWRTGLSEMKGSLSKRAFMDGARRYVPELTDDDVLPGPAGIRAQAVDPDGGLVDDFRISRRGRVLAVRNAPSPAATSSLAIAEHVVAIALDDAPADVSP
ncbi:MAG: putative dependent oxidoreductase [Frankiales bacterium]|jgi:L-2-hydroxyglutarate oxidase|nr:putative dependent oxidoreductase [Frankiales bacterium]